MGRLSLVASALAVLALAYSSPAFAAGGCTLSVVGSGTSTVFIDASSCAGDTIAIVAGAEGNQKQFPVGEGPEMYSPFNINQCDLDVSADQAVPITYTAVVVSGPDKGVKSATYSGTLAPDPPVVDAPPSVSLSGEPSPHNFVRPGEVISLSVTAMDDFGLTAVKVTDPGNNVLLDKRITPPKISSKCHPQPVHQSVTLALKPFVVPSNPPTPTIRFTARARDTAGQETTGAAEYLTEAMWSGEMLLAGSGGISGNVCTTNWRISLLVKTTAQNEVTGTAEARHNPIQGCRYAGPRDLSSGLMTFVITGIFDGKLFRLFFEPKATGGAGVAWALTGLHLLALPTPLPVDLTLSPGDRNYAKGSIGRDNSGNVEGRGAASIAGWASLHCCDSDPGPATTAKTPPLFLGESNEPMPLGGNN